MPKGPMTTDLARLEEAAALVRTVMPPTPQYCWPLLSRRVGAELWVKHENHTPTGAFKVRGGLVYLDELRRSRPEIARRHHRDDRQSRPEHRLCRDPARARRDDRRAARQQPGEEPGDARASARPSSRHGHDFQAAYEHAAARAEPTSCTCVRSFHPLLVRGVASYGARTVRARSPGSTRSMCRSVSAAASAA